MTIDTRIDGDPESIRRVASWLKSTLNPALVDSATQVYRVRSDSEWTWTGAAGDGFRMRMTSGAAKVDQMAIDAHTAGQDFDTFADDMVTAKVGMERTRQIARDGGLGVIDDQIQNPGPAPTAPQALPADGPVTPAMVQAYNDGVRAQQVHAQQVAAYAAASQEANNARRVMDDSITWLRNKSIEEFKSKGWLHATDFGVNSAMAGAVAARVQNLRRQADFWLQQRDNFNNHYHRGGGTHRANAAQDAFNQADDAVRRASSVAARFGGKLPVIGLGITATGIGLDISQGKPVGQAVFSGLTGTAAAAGFVAVVGGPVVWVAAGGILVGVAAGWGADAVYDGLPQGVKDGIENGIDAVGGAIGDAGSAIGSGAKQVWDSVF